MNVRVLTAYVLKSATPAHPDSHLFCRIELTPFLSDRTACTDELGKGVVGDREGNTKRDLSFPDISYGR